MWGTAVSVLDPGPETWIEKLINKLTGLIDTNMSQQKCLNFPLHHQFLTDTVHSVWLSTSLSSPPSLLPVQRVGRGLRYPRAGPGGLVTQTWLSGHGIGSYFLFLNILPPVRPWPDGILFPMNAVFFLRSVLASRPWIQSSRWDSHFSCFTPAGNRKFTPAQLNGTTLNRPEPPWTNQNHPNCRGLTAVIRLCVSEACEGFPEWFFSRGSDSSCVNAALLSSATSSWTMEVWVWCILMKKQ